MSTFQERFKGKTSVMTKEGINSIVKSSDNPIPKNSNTYNSIQQQSVNNRDFKQGPKKQESHTFEVNRPFLQQDNQQQYSNTNLKYGRVGQHKQSDPYLEANPFEIQDSQINNNSNVSQQINSKKEQIKNNSKENIIKRQRQTSRSDKQEFSNKETEKEKQHNINKFRDGSIKNDKEKQLINKQIQKQQQINIYQSAKHFKENVGSMNDDQKQSPLNRRLQQNQQQNQMQYVPSFAEGSNTNLKRPPIPTPKQQQMTNNQGQPLGSLNEQQFQQQQYNQQFQQMYQNPQLMVPNPIFQYNSFPPQGQQYVGFNMMQPQQGYIDPMQSMNQNVYNNQQMPMNVYNPYNILPTSSQSMPDKIQQGQLEQQQNNYNQNENTDEKNKMNYTPYSLKEYQDTKKMVNYNYTGLGPNIGSEDWNKKKEKVDRMLDFANQVKFINSQNLPPANARRPIKKEEQKEKSTREKAIDFAKNIPKPKVKPQNQYSVESSNGIQSSQQSQPLFKNSDQIDEVDPNMEDQEQNNELEKLERQHLEYLNQIDKINGKNQELSPMQIY